MRHLAGVKKVVRWIRSYLTGRTYRVQMADALSQETRFKSGAPKGSVIGPLLFLLFVYDLPSVISVTTLVFADDVKMVSPRSQRDLLQGFLYNVWNWSVNWDLPSNPTKCSYIAIGQAPSLQSSFATGSPGNSIQVTNVVGCSHGQSLLTLHPLQRGCHQRKADVYDKAVVR